DGSYTHYNFDNSGITGDVTADDASYSINRLGGTVGDVLLLEDAIFDNYGTVASAAWGPDSLFNNYGTLTDAIFDGGGGTAASGYTPETIVNLTVINDGPSYNRSNPASEPPDINGTITGSLTVGDTTYDPDTSTFINAVGDQVLGNIDVH